MNLTPSPHEGLNVTNGTDTDEFLLYLKPMDLNWSCSRVINTLGEELIPSFAHIDIELTIFCCFSDSLTVLVSPS